MIRSLEINIERLSKPDATPWFIITEDGKPLQFVVAAGQFHFFPAPWAGASLFLKSAADAVQAAASSLGRTVTVARYVDHLTQEKARMEALR